MELSINSTDCKKMKFNLGIHGEVIKSISLGNLTLTETAYQAEQSLPRHAHSMDYFCFVLQGDFTEFYERKSRLCLPSTLVFHPAGEIHADKFHAPARCFNIQPDVSWLKRIRHHSPILDRPADFRDGLFGQLTQRLYKEFCRQDGLSALVIEGLALEILGETARRSINPSNKQPPLWLVQTRELLREEFYENFSLAKIAESVGIHETHLSREFRRFYGITVGEYVRERRIDFACRRLAHSKDSLAAIAHAAGFFDQSHFTRAFKSQTGLTPNQYRINFGSR